ncbi:MAG: ABC transporter ATP-binding protein [Geminicoccaceae bacterium]|nr:ABC transporter ATP-binding protein [Geminicoccaceae bacterium]
MSKRFGSLQALDKVDLLVRPGTVHALLGENGAGKSTLVKCIMGFYRADEGSVVLDDREVAIASPRDARALGIGMVYQHFTLVPSLTGAENLVIARADTPLVIDWRRERDRLEAFLARMPLRVPLDRRAGELAAGEKQKLELLKLLYLDQRFLILDEPTSVLTPDEALEVLGFVRRMAREGAVSVLLITHKFREVEAFADEVTILRRGRRVGGGAVGELSTDTMAALMVGERQTAPGSRGDRAPGPPGPVALELAGLVAEGDRGALALDGVNLEVRAREIVGVAGVSGNGQKELVECLFGQRPLRDGRIFVKGEPFEPTREAFARFALRGLPEQPLENAAVRRLTVAENLALRSFDRPPLARGIWLDRKAIRARAKELIERYRIRPPDPDTPLEFLSGGNVQRTVLARELSEPVEVLVVANPCFGLDFASTADIRAEILAQRDRGAAVLLISEDLDEILELADRILVLSAGKIVHAVERAAADRTAIGRHMAGH